MYNRGVVFLIQTDIEPGKVQDYVFQEVVQGTVVYFTKTTDQDVHINWL